MSDYGQQIAEMSDWPMMSIWQRLRILWWSVAKNERWTRLTQGIDEGRTLRSAYDKALET